MEEVVFFSLFREICANDLVRWWEIKFTLEHSTEEYNKANTYHVGDNLTFICQDQYFAILKLQQSKKIQQVTNGQV